MDKKGRRSHQNEKSSIAPEMSSCASSITLVEPITSTSSLLSNSDSCCGILSRLPPHLLFQITAHLDIVSKICLQSTNHYFRSSTHTNRGGLNTCARYLLAHRFGQNGDSTTELKATRFLCIQSRMPDGAARVRCLDEPRHETSKWIARALDRLPWVRRNTTLDLDKRHLYRKSGQRRPKYWAHLMVQLGIHPFAESILQCILMANQKPAWLAFRVWRCMHCGKGITEGDTRLQGCLHCKCDFCFQAPEIYFRRCGPGRSNERRPGQIFKNRADGGTYAVEGSGKNRISVPVYNPFELADRTYLLDKRLLQAHIGDVNKAGAVKRGDLGGATQLEVDNKRDALIMRWLRWCEGVDSWGEKCQVESI